MVIDTLKVKIKQHAIPAEEPTLRWFPMPERPSRLKTVEVDVNYLQENGQTSARRISAEVWSDALQWALDTYHNVRVPRIDSTIYLNRPITMKSGYHLIFDPSQQIALLPHVGTCMLRNENVRDGSMGAVSPENRDVDISVEGGIWTTLANGAEGHNGNPRGNVGNGESMQGAFAVLLLHHIEGVQLRNITIQECVSYGIQIGDCKNFVVENIQFVRHQKDGVHVNGPAEYGVIRNLCGKDIGDDMVALNAWDWYTSAITFGSIRHILVENVVSNNNELRILPGRKMFDDGSYIDCDISDCCFENITGVYTYKLYCQPNIANAIQGINDTSGTVGTIANLYFRNIRFDHVRNSGFADIPVKGLFEICANCDHLYFENIQIDDTLPNFRKNDIHVLKVGPLSSTWTWSSDNPEEWGEVFSPDDVCLVKNVKMKRILFLDEYGVFQPVSDFDVLAEEVHLTVNEDYPHTLPKGGTGYGTLERLLVEC